MCAIYIYQTVQAQITEKLYISARRVPVSSLARDPRPLHSAVRYLIFLPGK